MKPKHYVPLIFIGALIVLVSFYSWVVFYRIDTLYAANFTESGFERISSGMTSAQVRKILGDPLETRIYNSSRREAFEGYWYYSQQDENPRANYYVRIVVFNETGMVLRKVAELEID